MTRLGGLFSKVAGLASISQKPTIPQLIERESKIGGDVFGKTSRGVKRRFFLDEQDSWFFSESAVDTTGQKLYSFTIRYQMLPQGVLKSVDGKGHVFIEGVELEHLLKAIALYEKRVMDEVYADQSKSQTLTSAAA